MIFFILWALLFLAIVIAVPAVIMRENKARLAAMPRPDAELFDDPDDAVPDEEFGDDGGFGDDADEVVEDFGGDDLAAFDK